MCTDESTKRIHGLQPGWDNWAFQIYERFDEMERLGIATTYGLNLEVTWEMHRKIYKSQIPKLDREAVKELAQWMGRGNVPKAWVELAAEDLSCEHLEALEYGSRLPRLKKARQEVEAIRDAAIKLERALVSASPGIFSHMPEEYWPREPKKDGEIKIYRVFDILRCGMMGRKLTPVNPKFLETLQSLAKCANFVMDHTPGDRGGADGAGKWAKQRLVLTARNTLRNLGLPYGAHKGGAVSKFVALVHRAATGKEAPWADKFAAMAPRLEKER